MRPEQVSYSVKGIVIPEKKRLKAGGDGDFVMADAEVQVAKLRLDAAGISTSTFINRVVINGKNYTALGWDDYDDFNGMHRLYLKAEVVSNAY